MTALAPQSRLAELVCSDLPPGPQNFTQAPSRGRPPRNWTEESVKYDKTDVPPKAFLDSHATERARGHILVRLGDSPCPSHAELQKELDLGHRSAVGWHIKRLEDEGLARKVPGGKALLTPQGRAARAYLMAYAGGESVWRRIVRTEFGSFKRAAARAMREAGRKLDCRYDQERDGLTRRRRAGEGTELERKVSYRQVIRALRSCSTTEAAVKKCGLASSGALRDRIATLLRHARRLLETP